MTTAIVTGASRGFGRAAAVALASSPVFGDGLRVVLVGRTEAGLEDTREAVDSVAARAGRAGVCGCRSLSRAVSRLCPPIQHNLTLRTLLYCRCGCSESGW